LLSVHDAQPVSVSYYISLLLRICFALLWLISYSMHFIILDTKSKNNHQIK
jgi:hypothetical protein